MSPEEKFIEDVNKLELVYPTKTIAELTGYDKSNINLYINGKAKPTKAFLKKFYSIYNAERNILENPKVTYGKKEEEKDEEFTDINALLNVLTKQANTLAIQARTLESQQETIHFLTTHQHPMSAGAVAG